MVHPTNNELEELNNGIKSAVSCFSNGPARYIFIRAASAIQENAKTCRLCEVLWDTLRKSNKNKEPPIEIDGKLTLCALKLEDFAVTSGQTAWKLPRLSIAISAVSPDELHTSDGIRDLFPDAVVKATYALQVCDIGQPTVKMTCDYFQEVVPDKFSSLQAVGGRYRQLQVDTRLIKYWINRCDTTHETCPKTKPLNIGDIRLINVNDCCVEVVSTNESVKYIALSYVWGEDIEHVTLNKTNMNLMHEKDSLARFRLPNTILDAIKLAQLLGYEYLWVDALCIRQDENKGMADDLKARGIPEWMIQALSLQDDEDFDKFDQLGKMDRIYGGAHFTLIAASGHNADAPIPGLREPRPHPQDQVMVSRKVEENVKDGTCMLKRDVLLMTTLRPQQLEQDHYLEGTVWNTRGWTFQERVLSSPCLIFTDEQVYWECRNGSFCEESNFDMFPVKTTRISREPWLLPDWNEVLAGCRSGPSEDATILALNTYEKLSNQFRHLVLRYTLRTLGQHRDGLFAFTGVLNSLTSSWGEDFFWGLPKSSFEQHLMWSSGDNGHRMGFHSAPDYTGVKWTLPFPTWSWIAWKGHVWLPVSNGRSFYLAQSNESDYEGIRERYAEHTPEIRCYAFDPQHISYNKEKKTWDLKDCIRPIREIRRPTPEWVEHIGPINLKPRPWRRFCHYEYKYEIGELSPTEDKMDRRGDEYFDVNTPMAVISLNLGDVENVRFNVGIMDGPQTLVFFWASWAQFTVSWEEAADSQQFLYDPADPQTRRGWHKSPAILDDDGKCVGYMNPMHDWFYQQRKLGEGKQEFVVLGSYLDKTGETPEARLDVMLIKWEERVAKRIAVGNISEAAWTKASRKWRLVPLG
jgi:hypothetical protein